MNTIEATGAAIFLLSAISFCRSQYNLGFCRSLLVQSVYDSSVTLESLVLAGDYTVLYTSGLKQFDHVVCARFGYTHVNSTKQYQLYSYVQTSKKREVKLYHVSQIRPGKLNVLLELESRSLQYVVYDKDGVLLIYWCKEEEDDNFDNNIWIIAVKTSLANEERTRKAVLDMLYHDDYRNLIDNDIEGIREEDVRYLELRPCEDSDGLHNLTLRSLLVSY